MRKNDTPLDTFERHIYAYNATDNVAAIELLTSGKLDPKACTTNTFPNAIPQLVFRCETNSGWLLRRLFDLTGVDPLFNVGRIVSILTFAPRTLEGARDAAIVASRVGNNEEFEEAYGMTPANYYRDHVDRMCRKKPELADQLHAEFIRWLNIERQAMAGDEEAIETIRQSEATPPTWGQNVATWGQSALAACSLMARPATPDPEAGVPDEYRLDKLYPAPQKLAPADEDDADGDTDTEDLDAERSSDERDNTGTSTAKHR